MLLIYFIYDPVKRAREHFFHGSCGPAETQHEMDIAGLKAEMLAHPGSYRSGFIILINYENKKDAYQKEIIDALGKDNIRCLQFIEDYVMVVSLKINDVRDSILVSLRNHTFGLQEPTKYIVDSVFPIPAYIEILITDILQGLAAAHIQEIRKGFAELFTEITHIEMDFIEWDGVTTNGGDLMVKGNTRNLESTLDKVGMGKRALLGNIEGRVTIKKFSSLSQPKEKVGNVKILWEPQPIKRENVVA